MPPLDDPFETKALFPATPQVPFWNIESPAYPEATTHSMLEEQPQGDTPPLSPAPPQTNEALSKTKLAKELLDWWNKLLEESIAQR